MSSKSSNEKVEPIKLDTTILKIEVKTNGDLLTKEFDLIPFHPNMSDMKDLSNNNYILFPSFVKVTMNYLKQAGVGQDFRKVFTNLEKYIQLIRFLTHPNKEVDEDFTLLVDQTKYKDYALSFVQDFTSDITQDFRSVQKYETLTDAEIITNNIGIIKSIFLPVNGRFFVLGHEYIINQSKYLPPYKASNVFNEKLTDRKKVPLNYSITVELQLLDVIKNPGMGDFNKLTCQQKKINLKKDSKEIFGDTFGYTEPLKAVLPPLTPTTVSKRGFGKLQLEWEERNKYVKPPTNEAERLAIESKWTPIQKKLAQYDKYQEDYNKVPPLWIKDQNNLNNKYDAFEKEMIGYVEEIKKITDLNQGKSPDDTFVEDLKTTVKDKMLNAIGQLLVVDDKLLLLKYKAKIDEKIKALEDENIKLKADKKEEKVIPEREDIFKEIIQNEASKVKSIDKEDKLNTLVKNYNANKSYELAKQILDLSDAIKLINIFIEGKIKYDKNNPEQNPFYTLEKNQIDQKYVEPFLLEMKERQKDVNELKEANKKINSEIKDLEGDDYSITPKLAERAKIQAELLKKQTDLKMLEDKYNEGGIEGKKLTNKWEESLSKIKSLKANIDSDKEVGEKTILNDSVKKELESKLKEIKTVKEKLYKANYFEGKYSEITKEEIINFSKKPGDRPIEDVSLLERNLTTLQDEYLEIAYKLGLENQVQGWITLLSDDLTRIKVLKKGKEKEKEEKDSENKKISTELKNLADAKKEKTDTSSDKVVMDEIKKKIEASNKIIQDAKKIIKTEKEKPLNRSTETIIAEKEKIKNEKEKLEKSKDDLKDIENKYRTDRENTLVNDQDKIQKKIEPLIEAVDDIKVYEKSYDNEITKLKKLGKNVDKNTIPNSKKDIKDIKTSFLTEINGLDLSIEGGSGSDVTQHTHKNKHYRKYKKTRRAKKYNKNKTKSLKKRLRRKRKQRKTVRRY